MFKSKITLDKALFAKALERSKALGYSNISEYVTHLVEQDLDSTPDSDEKVIEDRLKGLGYL